LQMSYAHQTSLVGNLDDFPKARTEKH